MEMLNAIPTLLANNLWVTLIEFFSSWIVNYGWTIIVFTIILKLVLIPIDVLQRTASKKQTDSNALMQPEMDALREKYGNDRERLNQEQQKLYKKYNVKMGGICLPMLVSLIVTLVVFFTLFSGIRTWGNEKLYSTYHELDQTYISAKADFESNVDPLLTGDEYTIAQNEYIKNAINNKYTEATKQNSWFWIKNVWKSDSNTSPFVSFDDYANNKDINGANREEAKTRYDFIVNVITEDGKINTVNGYYILIIMAALVSFLSQFISAKLMTPKGGKLNMTNKIMMLVLPISMVIFAFNNNAVFGLYIITNSLMSAIISTTLTLIMRNKNRDKNGDIIIKKKNIEVVEYSRNYKK